MISRVLAGAVFETFAFAYGIICLAFVLFRAVQYGSVLQKPGAAFWEKVDKGSSTNRMHQPVFSSAAWRHPLLELAEQDAPLLSSISNDLLAERKEDDEADLIMHGLTFLA